jgi:hypothetical protein
MKGLELAVDYLDQLVGNVLDQSGLCFDQLCLTSSEPLALASDHSWHYNPWRCQVTAYFI